MGYRTVVMLSNDEAHKWKQDPELGRLIARAASVCGLNDGDSRVGNYGRVVECVHANIQTLAVLDGYENLNLQGRSHWRSDRSEDEIALDLLKAAADKLGYKLVKKPAKKGD